MIGKVKTGTYFKGALKYNQKGEIIDKTVLADKVNKQAKEMITVSDQNKRTKNRVKHFIISFSGQDKLDDYKLSQIGREYLEQMDYKNNQYITYKHTDTKHIHLHIVTNRIDLSGKAVKDSNEKRKSRDILMNLEKKYNLTPTNRYSKNKATKKNTQAYKAAEKRLNKEEGRRTDKQIIHDQVWNAIKERPKNEKEFSDILEKTGITLNTNKAGNGYNFEFKGVKYKASAIHRKLTYSKLQKEFNYNTKKKENKQQSKPKPKPEPKQKQVKSEPTKKEPEQIPEQLKTALKEKNFKMISDIAHKNPDKKLTEQQIRFITNHPDYDDGNKRILLAAGNIDNPKYYLPKQQDTKLDKMERKEQTRDKNKGKNNDLKM